MGLLFAKLEKNWSKNCEIIKLISELIKLVEMLLRLCVKIITF